MNIRMIAQAIAAGSLISIAGYAAPATAAAIYNYQGMPMNCVGFASSCTVKVVNPHGFTASFTLPQDFDSNYNGDQTYYAFAYNHHFITDWSIFDGATTLSSANGDVLDPTSSLTYNNGVIRTWNIAASNPSGSILFHIAPHADYTSINGAVVIGRSLGTWSTGTGSPQAGSVPEPATWAMALIGVAMIGASLRYRRREIRVAVA